MTRAMLAALALAGCEPTLDQRLATIDAPRIIAAISEPPEIAPTEIATHRAVVATPTGEVMPDVAWAFCTEPKPPTEDNAVNARCLGDEDVLPLASGPTTMGEMPFDACQRFGPDPPPGGDYRPRDPDVTGGFYQPLRLTLPADLGGGIGFASHRIACDLGNAPGLVAQEFRARYVRNVNPPPAEVARADGVALTTPIARGAVVELVATWPPGAAEPYVSYQQATASLLDRREAMRATWYVTGGSLEIDASGVAEDEPGAAATNAWTAPDAAGAVTLWVVLRDSRGGSSSRAIALSVE